MDQNWAKWNEKLSASYAKTVDLLEKEKVAEAKREYQTGCAPTVKDFYAKAAKTYPARFKKILWERRMLAHLIESLRSRRTGHGLDSRFLPRLGDML